VAPAAEPVFQVLDPEDPSSGVVYFSQAGA
jgi:hypothetical protein